MLGGTGDCWAIVLKNSVSYGTKTRKGRSVQTILLSMLARKNVSSSSLILHDALSFSSACEVGSDLYPRPELLSGRNVSWAIAQDSLPIPAIVSGKPALGVKRHNEARDAVVGEGLRGGESVKGGKISIEKPTTGIGVEQGISVSERVKALSFLGDELLNDGKVEIASKFWTSWASGIGDSCERGAVEQSQNYSS